jgi:hypothetical protein
MWLIVPNTSAYMELNASQVFPVMDFRNKLECLSLVSFFHSSLTNTLALYENMLIADKKSFLTLAPGEIFWLSLMFISNAKAYTCGANKVAPRWGLHTPGTTNWRERLSTVDFLIKVAGFVRKVSNVFNIKWVNIPNAQCKRVEYLNSLVQGGQLYWALWRGLPEQTLKIFVRD